MTSLTNILAVIGGIAIVFWVIRIVTHKKVRDALRSSLSESRRGQVINDHKTALKRVEDAVNGPDAAEALARLSKERQNS